LNTSGLTVSFSVVMIGIFWKRKSRPVQWHKARLGAVKSNRFRFDSIFDQEVEETFRFDFDSIHKTIRFDTKLHQQSWKKIGHQENGEFSKKLTTIKTWTSRNLFEILFCEILYFSCHKLTFFLFRFLSKSNRIVLKIEKVVWFDLDMIRFDSSKNIWFDKEIRFDFDSIWQPWLAS
jgi:hypothetical protein